MKSHELIDQRSLAFGQAIAARLEKNPELIDQARATLQRWLGTSSPGVQKTLQEWMAAFDAGPTSVVSLLTGTDERAVRLRQSSPFAGLLPDEERNAILLRFEAYDKSAT
jgi:hypothetical protein